MAGHLFLHESGQSLLLHYLVGVLGYTALAIGVIYVMYYILKKNPQIMNAGIMRQQHAKSSIPLSISSLLKSPSGSGAATGGNLPLTVESRLTLESNKSLYIVRAGVERFLVATSMEGTQTIARLTDASEATADSMDVQQLGASFNKPLNIQAVRQEKAVQKVEAPLPFQDILLQDSLDQPEQAINNADIEADIEAISAWMSPKTVPIDSNANGSKTDGQDIQTGNTLSQNLEADKDEAILNQLFEKRVATSKVARQLKNKLTQHPDPAPVSSIAELRKRIDIL